MMKGRWDSEEGSWIDVLMTDFSEDGGSGIPNAHAPRCLVFNYHACCGIGSGDRFLLLPSDCRPLFLPLDRRLLVLLHILDGVMYGVVVPVDAC